MTTVHFPAGAVMGFCHCHLPSLLSIGYCGLLSWV